MFRILGFLVGSALSIAALVMLVGMPDFHLTGEAVDADRYDAAIRKLKEKQQSTRQAVAEQPPVDDAIAAPLPVDDAFAGAAVDEAFDPASEMPAQAVADETSGDPPASGIDGAQAGGAAGGDLPEPEWQAFWNPFRSEIAAKGFVRRLESVTGLDYRVVRVETGAYQVAFSYENDTERSTKLSQISAATGLDLSDSLP